ncbi:uncharacterized protein LOC142329025 isoform X1 [Lycorma delicatula]|uniref:uncharacterized protein LOC142329025 isoform X1 n=1 Tax=Lycorma delicatula TaxID=130591 RepID=UPI003F50F3C4
MLGKGKLKETNIWFMNTKEKFVDDAFKYENIAKIGQGSYRILGPFVFNENLMGDAYVHFLKNNLPALLEDVPLQIRLQRIFQHNDAYVEFIRNDHEMIQITIRNILHWAECCVHCEGGNFEQLL